MKKFTAIIALFSVMFSQAQVTRFVYQLTMKPKKESPDTKTERVYLDVSPAKSLFYSEGRIKRDSVMNRMRETRSFDRSQMQNFRSAISYSVEKDILHAKLIYKDRIGRDAYSYTEDASLTWKIMPETAKIGNYKTQKAEAAYGGRTWTAWFTTDLPFNDGPYKFSGLPGLIVKVEDAAGDYSFDLVETKKISDFPDLQSRGQAVAVSKEKFLLQQKKFSQDPSAFMQPRTGNSVGRDINPQRMQQVRQQLLQEMESNNNPIELN